MEIRFQRFLLMVSLTLLSATSFAQEDELLHEPEIERRSVNLEKLDNENFEFGMSGGILSIEDFESDFVFNAHFAYHINEDFYFKLAYSQADAGKTSFEKLANVDPLLTDEERELTYYGLVFGYNIFPSETFFGANNAFNSVTSIQLGAGNTEFAGEDEFTLELGIKYRLFLTDWFAWDVEMKDLIFETQVTGETKDTHNLMLSSGIAVYF